MVTCTTPPFRAAVRLNSGVMRSLILIATVLLVTACGATKPALPRRVAVLHPNYAQEVLEQCSRRTPSDVSASWAVSYALAAQIEADLPKLADQIPGGDPSAFYRQYVGIVQYGKRFVYINAFAQGTLEKYDNRWQTMPAGACDGGKQFWGALYDPAVRTFSAVAFNGPF